ncbi:DUF445 domain-containing protein [Longimonas halophila]|uniref:DUF445 domain-containing protein n=1 Tax=Longimonas halophila TaxID=1469170 RepID=A0A2H3NMK6_9BACT|nr:DUF445 family protein [Longimonas halophila]PEN07689.1 DUF445 domain-containing protein [Longimonas halophila]
MASPVNEHSSAAPEDSAPERSTRSLLRHLLRHTSAPASNKPPPAPPKNDSAHARWLPILRVVPVLLAIGFAASFVWDFNGIVWQVGAITLPAEGLLRIVCVSGLIGFGTNWLAITMLFQPREKRPLIGQGLVPAQREYVAHRLAQAVSDELINAEILQDTLRANKWPMRLRETTTTVARDLIDDPAFQAAATRWLRTTLREVLAAPATQERLRTAVLNALERENIPGMSGWMLRAVRSLRPDLVEEHVEALLAELPQAAPRLAREMVSTAERVPGYLRLHGRSIDAASTLLLSRLIQHVPIDRIILEKVRAYDEQQLERLLKRTTNTQLTYIKYLGAVLGMLGGWIIWAPGPALVVLGSLGGSVALLDVLLYRWQQQEDTEAAARPQSSEADTAVPGS